MKGKLGIAVGLAAGYVLGTRAGRERYQQLTASAKRFADEPSLQRLQEELNGLFGSGGQANGGGTSAGRAYGHHRRARLSRCHRDATAASRRRRRGRPRAGAPCWPPAAATTSRAGVRGGPGRLAEGAPGRRHPAVAARRPEPAPGRGRPVHLRAVHPRQPARHRRRAPDLGGQERHRPGGRAVPDPLVRARRPTRRPRTPRPAARSRASTGPRSSSPRPATGWWPPPSRSTAAGPSAGRRARGRRGPGRRRQQGQAAVHPGGDQPPPAARRSAPASRPARCTRSRSTTP